MTSPKNRVTLSASSVKTFLDCSWLFYQQRFNKVPDWTWPATYLGSLVHIILECLCNPRHKHHLEAVRAARTVYAVPAIERLIRAFRYQNPALDEVTLSDLDKLTFVALDHDFHFEGAKLVLPPEFEFEIDFGTFQIKGFVDRLALYEGKALIRDFKSQKKPFTVNELAWNIQSLFYQLAIRHHFKVPSVVEFLMLRHPATKRKPDGPLQTVPPSSDAVLDGFIAYLETINRAINALTPEVAAQNVKVDKDEGFCLRVCSLREPFDYWAITDKAGKTRTARVSKHVAKANPDTETELEDILRQLKPQEGEVIEKRRYAGCIAFHDQKTERRIR